MAGIIDSSVGIGVESTFKTYATPTFTLEHTSESLKWSKNTRQGRGMRVGSRVARSSRRVVPTAEGGGDIAFDVSSKGLGKLWQAAMGSATSTLVSAGLYQQVHTFGDTPSSLTVQKGVVRADGTVDAYSFLGCMVDNFSIDSPTGDIISAKLGMDAADITTAQAYATPAYPAGQEVLHFGQVVAQIGGTVTAPTGTALATVATPITVGVRSFNINITNGLDKARWNYGQGGRKSKQLPTGRVIKGTFVAEYDQVTLRDAYLADTDTSIVFTATGSVLGAGNVAFQIVLPVLRLDGDLPPAQGDAVVTVPHTFEVLDGLSQQAMSLVTRTADTAI